jgi:hypothetical protein
MMQLPQSIRVLVKDESAVSVLIFVATVMSACCCSTKAGWGWGNADPGCGLTKFRVFAQGEERI